MIQFPEDFIWGSATSSYQIEGGSKADGKGPSIWDAFSSIPGKTYGGETGRTACGHYDHFREDVILMKKMGLKAYRFSISWSRILPTGRGEINKKGIGFYNHLINDLLKHDIEPWVTLYHWDLTMAHQLEKDGWLNPELATIFADYACVCFEQFGDRVKHWITLNEAWVVSILGHGHGVFAPGRISKDEPYIAGHNLLLAHAKAVDIYRKRYQASQKGRIGITNNCDWREPETDSYEDKQAAQRALEFYLGWFADPVHRGCYPEVMVERLGKRLPRFTRDETRMLKGSSDFFGLNHYTTMYAAHSDGAAKNGDVYGNGGIAEDQNVVLSVNPNWKKTGMNWSIVPWGCRKLLQWIDQRYDHPEIIITENGCAFPDGVADGSVNDIERVDYIKSYLSECHRAMEEGVNLKGYFVWSLLDNFEWALGYNKRFGLHYVDFKTLKRIPKVSAGWYRDVIKKNGF